MRKLSREEREQKEIQETFKIRQEFRQWVRIMEEKYINKCDNSRIEVSTD
jgi:hypothetical protein